METIVEVTGAEATQGPRPSRPRAPGPWKKGVKTALRAWVEAGEREGEIADLLDEIGRAEAPLEDPPAPR